jgi:hypothetical protein
VASTTEEIEFFILLKLKCDHIGQHRSAKDEGKLLQAKDGGQKCASV